MYHTVHDLLTRIWIEPVPQQNCGETQLPSMKPKSVGSATASQQNGHLAAAMASEHEFFEDDGIRSVQSRAIAYLGTGIPVHLRGPAGMGKTTLAIDVAKKLARPYVLVTGDGAMTSADLIGRAVGQTTKRVQDNFIHNVKRTESVVRHDWRAAALTSAMEKGHTLVYDEFTRAPAEANNALLSALEERVLVVPDAASGRTYVKAHEDFRVIFTSNPQDYVGVNDAPDALFDRMVTFDLFDIPFETETGIVACRSNLDLIQSGAVVEMVRGLRDQSFGLKPASMRTAILIARILHALEIPVNPGDGRYVQVCLDVLESRITPGVDPSDRPAVLENLRTAIGRTQIPPTNASIVRAAE